MQVNLSANMPNSAVETVTSKPAEKTDSESEGTFFAQMGQILNPDNGSRSDQTEEKPDEQVTAGTSNDPMNPLLAVSLISTNPTDTGELSNPHPPIFHDSDPAGATLWTPPIGSQPEIWDLEKKNASNMQDIKAPFTESPSADSQSNLQGTIAQRESAQDASGSEPGISQRMILQSDLSFPSESSAKPERHAYAADSELSMNPDIRNAGFQSALPEKLEGSLPGELYAANDTHCNESAASKPSVAENAPSASNSSLTQTMPLEARQPLNTRPASNAVSEELTPETNLSISRDAKQQIENSHDTISGKPEVIVNPALENAGSNESRPDQDSSRNQSVSWMALQSKPAGSQVDSARARIFNTEHQKDVLVQSASGPAHSIESGKVTVLGPATEASGSQPKEFMLQLAERIQIQLRDGRSEIRIQLKPDGLGHLDIRAESTINGVVARIVAESSRVKEYLESNLPVLQQSLQDQGLRVDRIQVAVQDGFDPQSSSGYSAQFGHAGSGHNGNESRRSSSISESIAADQPEEMIIDPMMWISLNPNSRFYTVA